jgi:chromosome partitioning protein
MAGQVIAVINQKGGTGKTTLALNLAAGLARRAATAIVDADPQRSISQWVAMAGNADTLPHATPAGDTSDGDTAATISRLAQRHGYVVVDCPPTVQGPVIAAIMASAHKVLIPVLPSPLDLWASVEMAALVGQAAQKNPALQACLILNQVETRNALSRVMQQAVAEFDVPLLQASIQRRAAYRSAAVEGVSVYGLGSRGLQAVADIEAIIEEVLSR